MTKLTDTKLVILSAACARPDRLILPLPAHIKGGAVSKVVTGLLTRGLIEETEAGRDVQVWRETGNGHGVTLVATDAAFTVLGIERAPDRSEMVACRFNAGTNSAGEPAAGAPTVAEEAPAASKRRGRPRKAALAARDTGAPRKTRDDTKQTQLIAMLRRSEGATIAQIVEAIDWQPHSVRGAFAGALKKKLGLTVISEKVEGVRIYRLA